MSPNIYTILKKDITIIDAMTTTSSNYTGQSTQTSIITFFSWHFTAPSAWPFIRCAFGSV
ncbi:MAG: hypothetical protein Q4P17_02605 [Methanobacterium sp.]|nr:hypothetical protein [Methanobacterium sp.]